MHECDLLVLRPSGSAVEIEIKISKSDLKKEIQKAHNHDDKRIKEFYFAIPDHLKDCEELIPDRAGIITVTPEGYCKIIRKCQKVPGSRGFNMDEKYNLARLGTMRIWSLKRRIQKIKKG